MTFMTSLPERAVIPNDLKPGVPFMFSLGGLWFAAVKEKDSISFYATGGALWKQWIDNRRSK